MTYYRTGNYAAFYVDEPFNQSNLGACASEDFCYYQMLKAWKGKDISFPFVDSHDKTYNVRDDSDWDSTLKPRLRERLKKSKNIILFLSSNTKNSRALREEMEYGVGELGLPVIVVYPEYDSRASILNPSCNGLSCAIKSLWENVPSFKRLMATVPTLHIPLSKDLIVAALKDGNYQVQSKTLPGASYYKC